MGTDWSFGSQREQFSSNGHLEQKYTSSPNAFGRTLDFVDANCGHFAAAPNVAAGLPCGTIGAANAVRTFSQPTFSQGNQNYNGGIYAQDSWTINRLTLNYGARLDFGSIEVPQLPHPLGRFVNSFEYPAVSADALPRWGPDFSPRLSVAYDLFGDAKTALKFGFNKYVHDVTGWLPLRYSTASHQTDNRDWFDCHLNPAGTACSGGDPYGANGDDIAQNWEIGVPGNDAFGVRQPNIADIDNFARETNQMWTAGVQQEIMSGISVNAEFRRRAYHNTWATDNLSHNMSDFGAFPDGSPDPAMAGTGRYFDLVRPYPFVGSVTVFNIDPDVRALSNEHDRTRVDGYSNVYTGFELSIQGRLPGGGALFGGWSVEDTGRTKIYENNRNEGGSRYGGEVNECNEQLATGDNPNQLRFCDRSAYPRPYRHEFKISGTQPWSLPGLGDMQVGASLQAYPGGAGDWGGLQEGFYVHRTSTDPLLGTYSDRFFWQPGQCVAPCVLGGRLVPPEASTVGTSTTNFWVPNIPLASVKFPPMWTQLDVNIQKVFNIGNWRYDARVELFNALNNGVELWYTTNGRDSRGSTGAGFQSLSAWERQGGSQGSLLEGRVVRFAVTARF